MTFSLIWTGTPLACGHVGIEWQGRATVCVVGSVCGAAYWTAGRGRRAHAAGVRIQEPRGADQYGRAGANSRSEAIEFAGCPQRAWIAGGIAKNCRAEPGLSVVHWDGVSRLHHARSDSTEHPGKPRLVHAIHPLP